ncbi:hypothetical protein, partial [Vibrio anguillarum]
MRKSIDGLSLIVADVL